MNISCFLGSFVAFKRSFSLIVTAVAVIMFSSSSFAFDIGDFVWLDDSNTNGLQDVGEPGITNIPVRLFHSNNTFVAQTFTDASGFYSFTNIAPGDYFVQITPDVTLALIPTIPTNPSNNELNSKILRSGPNAGQSEVFTFTGTTITNIDAGYITAAPRIGLVKTADPAPDGSILYTTNGAVVTYSYLITNSGNTFLNFIAMQDDPLFLDGVFFFLNEGECLEPGGTILFQTQAVITVDITNIAIVSGSPVGYKNCTPQFPLDPATDVDDAVVLLSHPGVSVSKEWTLPTNGVAAVGEELKFQVTVVNTGNVPLATVPVEDSYETNYLTYVSSSIPASSNDAVNGTINWTNIANGTLEVGSNITFEITFTGINPTIGFRTNTVIASPTTTTNYYPGDLDPVTDTEPYDIVDPVVTITKTLINPTGRPAAIGETNIFLISVTNSGNYNLDIVPVDDTYDSTLMSYISAVPGPDSNGVNGAIGTLIWTNVGPLLVGESTNLIVQFEVVGSGIGTNYVVTAPETTNGVPVAPDDDPEGFTNVSPSVLIVKTLISPSGRPAALGETNVFTIEVTNTGDIGLDVVPVDDIYDSSLLQYISASPDEADIQTAGSNRWNNVGPLATNESTTITVYYRALSSGTGLNYVVTTPTNSIGIPVPPDEDTEGFTNVNPVVIIAKTLISPVNRPAAIGETNVFLITITNAGDVAFISVPVIDSYDTNLIRYIGATADPVPSSSIIDVLGTNTWTFGSLDVGSNITIISRFLVLTNGIGTNFVSTAPTATNGIPVPPDDDPEGFTNVNPRVSIVKTLTSPTNRPGIVGETNVFTIVIENTGDITLDTVPLTDTYDPLLLTFDSSDPVINSNNNAGVLIWTNVGPLAVGQSTTVVTRFVGAGPGEGENFVVTAPTTTNGIPVPPDDDPEGFTNITIFIGDAVWNDLNTNGLQNVGEPGINGATVNLYRVSGGVTSPIIDTATTHTFLGQQGYYAFSNLSYGVYVVEISLYSMTIAAPLLAIQTTPTSYVIDPEDPVGSLPNNLAFPSDGIVTNADFGFLRDPLTAIELMSFTAKRSDGGVLLKWETAVEFDSLGFNLYRASTAYEKARIKLTGTLIPAVGGDKGAKYSFEDLHASEKVGFLYWLEEVAVNGDTEMFGPVAVYPVGVRGDDFATASLGGGGLVRIDYEALVDAGVAVYDINPAKLKVYLEGVEVAAYVSTEETRLQAGDYVIFYAPPAAGERKVSLAAGEEDASGMHWIYARPARGGDLAVLKADDTGSASFITEPAAARTMISGFTNPTIWVLDTSNPQQPSILYGQVVVKGDVSGEYAVYFSVDPAAVTQGIAVQDDSIIDLKEIRSE